jgi:O-antigen/teichoic acid export membrane protein
LFDGIGELAERVAQLAPRNDPLEPLDQAGDLAVIARDFMYVFTGAEYRSAYPVLGIIAAATLLGGLVQLGSAGLSIHKQSKRIMANTLAATALDVALAIALVPRFGYMAAGWAAAAAYLLLVALTWLQTRRFMPWQFPWLQLLPVVGATAVMALAVWGVTLALPSRFWALAVEAAVGVAVYAAALLALGGVRADERAFVRELAGNARARLAGKR